MRILLIEDDPDISDAVLSRLRRNGHEVHLSENGRDGMEAASDTSLDVIVLDLNLPDVDGFAILRSIRDTGIKTPVVVVTARQSIDDKVSLFDLGADDYLVKPFDLRELEARLQAVMRRNLGEAQPQLQFKTLVINLSTGTATLSGNLLDLGRKEFQVLAALTAAAGAPVTKQRLVTRLFGFDDQGSDNAVELLISRLRKKLGDSPLRVATQRGVGYFLQ